MSTIISSHKDKQHWTTWRMMTIGGSVMDVQHKRKQRMGGYSMIAYGVSRNGVIIVQGKRFTRSIITGESALSV